MNNQYRQEFPDFPAEDLPKIPETFTDVSWRNDACPSFLSEELKLVIYVDYKDPSKRESEEGERFTILPTDDDGCLIGDGVVVKATDHWDEVLRFVEQARCQQK